MKEHLIHKLYVWVSSINEEHKRGLRVIAKVIEIKGGKRFKPRSNNQETVQMLDLNRLNYEDAQKEYRRMTNTTHYAQSYGQKPKALEDYEILKHRKFSEMQISSILKPHITQYIEKWLALNDQEEFTGRIYFTVRELYTVLRN